MKLNFKPWQIVVSAVAGVAVVGGSATGIWYGVSHSNGEPNNDPAVALVETETATEQALDEPSAAAPESTEEETEATTKKQTTKESTSESVTPSSEETITWELDTALSEEVSRLMSEKFPERIWDPSISHYPNPGNNIKNNQLVEINDYSHFVGKLENINASKIVSAWTECDLNHCIMRYNIFVYRYKGPGEGYIFAFVQEYW